MRENDRENIKWVLKRYQIKKNYLFIGGRYVVVGNEKEADEVSEEINHKD